MADDYEIVRREVGDRLGDDVLFAWEVKHTLDDLGLYYTIKSLKARLRSIRVLPKEMGVPAFTHGPVADASVYPASKVFAYLKSLESKGKVKLREVNAENFEDFVEKGHYTGTMPGYGGSAGKRIPRKRLHIGQYDTDPSSDNAEKIRENR